MPSKSQKSQASLQDSQKTLPASQPKEADVPAPVEDNEKTDDEKEPVAEQGKTRKELKAAKKKQQKSKAPRKISRRRKSSNIVVTNQERLHCVRLDTFKRKPIFC